LCAIGVTTFADFFEDSGDLMGCLAIGGSYCLADEFQTFNVGGWVEFWGGRSILLVVF
jgi:hypothetical protein